MDELVAWLRFQLDADQALAQAAYDEASDYEVVGSDLAELHFANWKPDRVLADIAAKRAIVDGCLETLSAEDDWDPQTDGGHGEEFVLARFVLHSLIEAYVDRPGYESWRPARSEA